MNRPPEFDRDLVKYYPRLLRYARKLSRNNTIADDCAQETVLKALAKWQAFQPGTNMRAWLFTICHNTYCNYGRDEKWFEHFEIERSADAPQDITVQAGEILALFSNLSPFHSEILSLAAQEATHEEMVEATGWLLGTVKSRLSRARDALSELAA